MFAKAFRLFVSSTFQDFGEERRLLQDEVIPALAAHCAKAGFGFRAVDMRWGVNDDAQLNQRTVEICLGEVIEAKGYPAPNLLILIGDRYGWVPLPFAIARDEFEALRDWLIAQGKSEAVADLNRVYALDENHPVLGGLITTGPGLIGAYTLRSREDELAELKAPDAWAPVEARLREALQAAARHLQENGQLGEAELEKYTLSLTEQEIRKGLERIVAGDGAVTANAIAWVRTTEASDPPVRALVEAVQRALPEGNALRSELPLAHQGYYRTFVEQITAKLTALVDVQIEAFKAQAQASDFALQSERTIHAAFAAERLRVFAGRHSNLAAIAEYIAGEARHPLVLIGISGSGKTALMARAAAQTKGAVVQRFVGASASSASQRKLLMSLIEDLAALGVASMPEQWENEDDRFVKQVRDLLSGLDQPVAIFIDALDQLRAPYRPMWLPPQLHPKVRLIISVLDDEAFAAERTIVQGLRRLPAEAFLAIEPLSEKDGADILAGLKREAQRGLTSVQEAFILERFHAAGASPLWLRIAFAIARRWRCTDDQRARGLAGDVAALIGQFLDELSSAHHHEPLLVRRTLGLIAAGREGLSESEAIAVLSRDAEVMAAVSSERFGAKTDRLPDSVWVRLKQSLLALLVEKGEEGEALISFFHRQVTEVVRARFYVPEKTALHGKLAAYFDPATKAAETDPPWTRRGFVELPFQLFHAGMRERLDALLTDPAWIDKKISTLQGVAEIVSDYEQFADAADPLEPLIGRALRLAEGPIARDLPQRMPQLHGRLIGLANPEFLLALVERAPKHALIEVRSTLTSPGREVARVELGGNVSSLTALSDGQIVIGSSDGTIRIWDTVAHTRIASLELRDIEAVHPSTGRGLFVRKPIRLENGAISALAALPDGRVVGGSHDNRSGSGRPLDNPCSALLVWDHATGTAVAWPTEAIQALAPLPGGRIASGSNDNTILIWDIATGTQTTQLAGRGIFVRALAVLSDGRLASGLEDGTIRIWDLPSGIETTKLKGHSSWVLALAVLPSGCLASGSDDKTIRIWDATSGAEIGLLKGHGGPVNALASLPDGRLVSGSDDQTIRIWDPAKGVELSRCHGHDGAVKALACVPPGGVVSGSSDGTARLWNLAGEYPELVSDHDEVWALAPLSAGRIASGSRSGIIRIWDDVKGTEVARLQGHNGLVQALAIMASGHLVSGSEDATLRLWDLTTAAEVARLDGHRNGITALAVLPDDCLVSGSYDDNIHLWDLKKKRTKLRMEGHRHVVLALAALPDGRLASGSYDQTIRIWDTKKGKQVAKFEGDVGPVNALAVLPSGRLACGSEDGIVRIWDVANSTQIARFTGHQRRVSALAVLPDGRLASASWDNTIRVWNLTTGREDSRLDVDGKILAMASLIDGRIVASDSLGRLHRVALKR
jgi:WD40 repeat protein